MRNDGSRPALLAALIDERLNELGFNLVETLDQDVGYLSNGALAVYDKANHRMVAILINPVDPKANNFYNDDSDITG